MAVFSLGRFFREQQLTLPSPVAVGDVSSKTFMVTGSSVGLGFEASVRLTKMGPKLVVATSRDPAQCEETRKSIRERVIADGVSGALTQVAAWPLDLDTFANVRAFVDRFAAEGDGSLNVLVANAGLLRPEYAQTTDGWEVMLQVNYLSTALLCILLLPYLVNASTADSLSRLVLVSSDGHYLGASNLKHAHKWTNILDTINGPTFGSSVARYNVTKLLGILFVRELATRLTDPTPVVACAVNPGYCRTRLFRAVETKRSVRWALAFLQSVVPARSTEEGSKTLVHAAVAGKARSMHGRFLSSCQVAEESDFVFTPEGKAVSSRLWDETITVLSRVDDRVPDIVAKYLRADG